jgi:DNA-binding XRE family transcriptional regulator
MKQWTPEDLINFRRTNKLTQTQLGKFVGVSRTTVYQGERGERNPSRTAKILLSRIEKEF